MRTSSTARSGRDLVEVGEQCVGVAVRADHLVARLVEHADEPLAQQHRVVGDDDAERRAGGALDRRSRLQTTGAGPPTVGRRGQPGRVRRGRRVGRAASGADRRLRLRRRARTGTGVGRQSGPAPCRSATGRSSSGCCTVTMVGPPAGLRCRGTRRGRRGAPAHPARPWPSRRPAPPAPVVGHDELDERADAVGSRRASAGRGRRWPPRRACPMFVTQLGRDEVRVALDLGREPDVRGQSGRRHRVGTAERSTQRLEGRDQAAVEQERRRETARQRAQLFEGLAGLLRASSIRRLARLPASVSSARSAAARSICRRTSRCCGPSWMSRSSRRSAVPSADDGGAAGDLAPGELGLELLRAEPAEQRPRRPPWCITTKPCRTAGTGARRPTTTETSADGRGWPERRSRDVDGLRDARRPACRRAAPVPTMMSR